MCVNELEIQTMEYISMYVGVVCGQVGVIAITEV